VSCLDTGFLTSVNQSGVVGQVIVIALFAVSVYSWAVIFYKASALRRALRRSEEFLAKFHLTGINFLADTNVDFFYDESGMFGHHSMIPQIFDGETFDGVMMYG